jgi:O-antigen/teichoic acid export membrane protein
MLGGAIVLARQLGRQGFGEFGIITSTAGMFSAFAGFGVGTTATRYVAALRETNPARAGRIVALSAIFTLGSGIVFGGIMFGLAPWIASEWLAAPGLFPHLRVASLALIAGAVSTAQTGALTGLEAFGTTARLSVLGSLATVLASVLGASWFGLPGAVWGVVVPSIGLAVAAWVAVRREGRRLGIRIAYRQFGSELEVLWRFSLPAFLAGSLVGPVLWGCMALIARLPDGYSQVGLFHAANQWFAAILFIPGQIGNVLLPVLSEQHEGGNRRRVQRILTRSTQLMALVVCLPCLLLALASPYVILLYGQDYAAASGILALSVLTAAVVAMMTPVSTIIAATGHMWAGFWMNLGWASAFSIATWCLQEKGALGLATARFVAYVLHLTWTMLYALRFLRTGDEGV